VPVLKNSRHERFAAQINSVAAECAAVTVEGLIAECDEALASAREMRNDNQMGRWRPIWMPLPAPIPPAPAPLCSIQVASSGHLASNRSYAVSQIWTACRPLSATL
jgi:hypothetical protein